MAEQVAAVTTAGVPIITDDNQTKTMTKSSVTSTKPSTDSTKALTTNKPKLTNQERILKFNGALRALFETQKYKSLPPEYQAKVRGMVYDRVIPRFYNKLKENGGQYVVPSKDQWVTQDYSKFSATQSAARAYDYVKAFGKGYAQSAYKLGMESNLASLSELLKAEGGITKLIGNYTIKPFITKPIEGIASAQSVFEKGGPDATGKTPVADTTRLVAENTAAIWDSITERAASWPLKAANEYDDMLGRFQNEHGRSIVDDIFTGGSRLAVQAELWRGSGEYVKKLPVPGKFANVGDYIQNTTARVKSAEMLIKMGNTSPLVMKGLASAKWGLRFAEMLKLGGEVSSTSLMMGNDPKTALKEGGEVIAADAVLRGMAKPISVMSKLVYNKIFAVGGGKAVDKVIELASDKLVTGENYAAGTMMEHPVDATAKLINEYATRKFGRTYDKLGWSQRQHIINNFFAIVGENAKNVVADNPELIAAHVKETMEREAKASPIAAASQKLADTASKASGGKGIIESNTENSVALAKKSVAKSQSTKQLASGLEKVTPVNKAIDDAVPSSNKIVEELRKAAKGLAIEHPVFTTTGEGGGNYSADDLAELKKRIGASDRPLDIVDDAKPVSIAGKVVPGAAAKDSIEFLDNLLKLPVFDDIFEPEDKAHKLLMLKLSGASFPKPVNNLVDEFLKEFFPGESKDQLASRAKALGNHLDNLRVSLKLGTPATEKFGMKVFRSTLTDGSETSWQAQVAQEIEDVVRENRKARNMVKSVRTAMTNVVKAEKAAEKAERLKVPLAKSTVKQELENLTSEERSKLKNLIEDK